MPNKEEIPAGTVDEVTGLTYNRVVPACTIHKMTLRSAQEPADCDVVIDWGDGTVQAIKDITWTTATHTAGKSYELSHDYASAMTQSSQRFVVKIYGKDYYTFRYNTYRANNLTSRIFAADLPIADHVTNFSSLAMAAIRLLKVKFPHSTGPYSNVWNWSSCFEYCDNLVSATGFEDLMLRGDAYYDLIFAVCPSLKSTDFVIPAAITEFQRIFHGCPNLECDINTLLPKRGFSSANIYIQSPFALCSKLYGTVPADKLWGDKHINWIIAPVAAKPFTDCSETIRAQVPVAWGGTLDEIIE